MLGEVEEEVRQELNDAERTGGCTSDGTSTPTDQKTNPEEIVQKVHGRLQEKGKITTLYHIFVFIFVCEIF